MAILVAFMFLVAQIQTSLAAITNDAVATATYSGNPVNSPISNQSVPVAGAAPAMTVTKTGVLNDDDGTPGLSAGDTISYTVTVENTGNVSLTNVVANDPLVTLTLASGDTDGDSEIDPGETWNYTASYTITALDLSTNGGGDGDIDNTVTISTDQLPDAPASTAVPINPSASMDVTKSGTLNDDDGTPGLSAGDTIDYVITVENTGLVTLTNANIADVLDQNGSSIALATTGPTGDTDGDSEIDPSETWQFLASHTITQANLDDGNDLANTATVTTDQVGPESDGDTQVLAGLSSSYTMTKTASLAVGDGDGLGDVGEIITFTFNFTNTGNQTLTNLAVSDPLSGLSAIACLGDGDSDGDIDSLLPGASNSCSATYTIVQADVDNGSLTNTATTTATGADSATPVVEDDTANDNSTTTPMDRVVDLLLTKTVTTPVAVLPNVYEYQYIIQLTNAGSTALTNLRMQDDLDAAIIAPAALLGAPSFVISGFTGTGGPNGGYDGSADVELLAGDVQLDPAASGTITITLRVDTAGQPFSSLNTAIGTATELPGPVLSDDPTQTPGDPNDVNPTPATVPDADVDGSPDTDESAVVDRDGDSVADAFDYDPTGYFYCEDDGAILSGGSIAVQNISLGGTQTGVGSSNNITILRDGSGGSYQFYVTAPGTYRIIPTLPPSGVASTVTTSSGTLDVTSLLPSNPGVIGAGETGSTGILSDFSSPANPYYTEFIVEYGDPIVFNNNIPLALCGTPELSTSKVVTSGPTLLPNSTSDVTFRIVAENTGTLLIDQVNLRDDLASVFGAGNYTINSLTIETAPPGFGAGIDPFFDGNGNQRMLTINGTLQQGELVSVLLSINVNVPDGVYTNTEFASCVSGFDGSALPDVSASVDITINRLAGAGGLLVSKSTSIRSARIGSVVPYTVTVDNNDPSSLIGTSIVDFMPPGFTYVPGTATLGGVPLEPVVSGRELVWAGQNLAGNSSLAITFSLAIGAAAPGTEFVNSAFIRNPVDGQAISNIAKAIIRLEVDPVLQCSDIVGRVFDDLDADGYYDDGEPGLGGVRVATVNGLLITTDQFGRYHVACDMIPDDRIGSNYILKLDTRTLPTGYRVTSENPRVVRVTRGKLSKINFAVANKRTVRLDVNDLSFQPGSTSLTPDALKNVARVLLLLAEESSVLKLTYRGGTDTRQLKRTRLKAIKALVEQAWAARERPFKLEIDAELKL